ncbi:MAG: hypothetical protein FWG12_02895 [Holophagaceae bacterium]|nr:hypothetical protein [Holophagaceae bacterium]
MKSPLIQAILALGLCSGLFAQTQQPPPEVAEINAAMSNADIPARVKELKRIKAAYPNSVLANAINGFILNNATGITESLEEALKEQKEILDFDETVSIGQYSMLSTAARALIAHPKINDFSGAEVLKAIQGYKDKGTPLFANPVFIATIPEDLREEVPNRLKSDFEIPIARAQVMAGNAQAALGILEELKKAGALNADYYAAQGEALLKLERFDEALDAYLTAAADGTGPAAESAKKIYVKVKGSEAGFDAVLLARKAQLPFHPPPFVAPENWQGKAVLAELFTGSECPPCVAADFAFDGFIESYPAKHLVVLEYHLPIPRYDPMMNPATKARQDYYGRSVITGTPTSIIDGTKSIPAGGGRSASEGSFNRVKTGIDPLLGNETPVIIKATATLSGDAVRVDCEFSKVVDDSDYNIVLVQGVEEFEGGNGIVHHKMVVRDIETIAPATSASVTFNIPESEKSAEEYVTEWAKTVNQGIFASSKWPQINYKIDRKGLKAVVFVQDKESKQVHNAFVADVK